MVSRHFAKASGLLLDWINFAIQSCREWCMDQVSECVYGHTPACVNNLPANYAWYELTIFSKSLIEYRGGSGSVNSELKVITHTMGGICPTDSRPTPRHDAITLSNSKCVQQATTTANALSACDE